MTIPEMTEQMPDAVASAVNRLRRYTFVRNTVWGCLTTAITLTVMAGTGIIDHSLSLTEVTVSALISFASAMGLAYITGSVIDYNGGIKPTVMGRVSAAKDEGAKG